MRFICRRHMMAEHPNAALVRTAVEAFNRGDPSVFRNLFAEDATLHIPGKSPLAGAYRGKAEIDQFFGHLAGLSEGPLHVDLLHVLTGGDEHVVAVWRAYGSRKGWDYSGIAGYLFHVRGGSVVEARNLQEDQDEIDWFWSA
jgi:ketosteroid isomerase-like protein